MNWNVAKSGKQKITVRMYPKYSSASKEMEKTLGLNAGVKFSIERELKGEDETVFEFKTPFKDFDGKGGGGFPYPNKPYYEETVFVNLEVPYQISVLDNAEKLYTDDTDKLKQLEQEVLSKYNQIETYI
jgi:hypothetical protein